MGADQAASAAAKSKAGKATHRRNGYVAGGYTDEAPEVVSQENGAF